MFTFNLVTADGAVWATVTVRVSSITAAAATLARDRPRDPLV